MYINPISKTKKNIVRFTIFGIIFIIAAMIICACLTSCGNMQIIDTTYSFERAIISLPNGEVIEGEVQSWTDYENSDQIQVKIDGKTYLVHNSDIVLISE